MPSIPIAQQGISARHLPQNINIAMKKTNAVAGEGNEEFQKLVKFIGLKKVVKTDGDDVFIARVSNDKKWVIFSDVSDADDEIYFRAEDNKDYKFNKTENNSLVDTDRYDEGEKGAIKGGYEYIFSF